MIALNAFFYYSGMMQIPLNVNANNIIMLNYQYIFYAIGACGALNWREFVERPTQNKSAVAGAILLALAAFYFLFVVKHEDAIVSHSFRLIHIIALWFALDFIPTFKTQKWMGNSFFLYCSHLIVLQCVQRICDIAIEGIGQYQPFLYVTEYIFLPIAIIVLLMIVAELLKKQLPKIYGALTGNRG